MEYTIVSSLPHVVCLSMSSSSRCVQNHYNRPTLVSRKKHVLVFGCLSVDGDKCAAVSLPIPSMPHPYPHKSPLCPTAIPSPLPPVHTHPLYPLSPAISSTHTNLYPHHLLPPIPSTPPILSTHYPHPSLLSPIHTLSLIHI